MKRMQMIPQTPGDFRWIHIDDLVRAWRDTQLPDLHQCSGACPGLNGGPPFHAEDWCLYLTVRWSDAVAIAKSVLTETALREGGLTDPDQVLGRSLQLTADAELGRAAASLINDPIELRVNPIANQVDNGRHRIAAMADQVLGCPVPVINA